MRYVCHVCVDACRIQRASELLELELQVVLSFLIEVLVTKIMSFTIAIQPLHAAH